MHNKLYIQINESDTFLGTADGGLCIPPHCKPPRARFWPCLWKFCERERQKAEEVVELCISSCFLPLVLSLPLPSHLVACMPLCIHILTLHLDVLCSFFYMLLIFIWHFKYSRENKGQKQNNENLSTYHFCHFNILLYSEFLEKNEKYIACFLIPKPISLPYSFRSKCVLNFIISVMKWYFSVFVLI